MISAGEVFKEAHRVRVGDLVIEKDYVLSWLLIAIAESDLRREIVFKGGTALKRIYYPEYRYSEDLDFTLRDDLSEDDLVRAMEALFPSLRRRPRLTCALLQEPESRSESTALYVNYVGPLGADLDSRFVKVDFTRRELLLDPLNELALQAPYRDYPLHVTIPTYTLEEILSEKLCALLQRTEARDLYDVYCVLEEGDADLAFLPESFVAKCEHKGQDPTRLYEVLTRKKPIFEKQWAIRLAEQVTELPNLNKVLRAVRRHVRKLGLA